MCRLCCECGGWWYVSVVCPGASVVYVSTQHFVAAQCPPFQLNYKQFHMHNYSLICINKTNEYLKLLCGFVSLALATIILSP